MSRTIPGAILSLLLASLALAEAKAEASPTAGDDLIKVSETNGEAVMEAVNPHWAPVTLFVWLTRLENATAQPEPPLTLVIDARSREPVRLLSIRPASPTASWHYRYEHRWLLGSYRARHNAATVYTLPFERGERFEVRQGPGGLFSHRGEQAIDWAMPEGTPVLAARSGTVVEVVQHFSAGGPDPALSEAANRVRILHDDGTIGSYLHLARSSVEVRVGQRVSENQPIARSGNSGFSAAPHLHFDVAVPTLDQRRKTFPIHFRTADSRRTLLREGESYERP